MAKKSKAAPTRDEVAVAIEKLRERWERMRHEIASVVRYGPDAGERRAAWPKQHALVAVGHDLDHLELGLRVGVPIARIARGVAVLEAGLDRVADHRGGSLYDGDLAEEHCAVFHDFRRPREAGE